MIYWIHRNSYKVCFPYFIMVKEEFEKIKWPIWLVIGLLIFATIVGFLISNYNEEVRTNTNSGEDYLKEEYDVSYFACNDEFGFVKMKSLGNREDQILHGLISLQDDCPDSEEYAIRILEPTKECSYFFGGVPTRIWQESLNQDILISEENKMLIETDTRFSTWVSFGKAYYELGQEYGTSEMDTYVLRSYVAYKEYLEKWVTQEILTFYMLDEMDNKYNCESETTKFLTYDSSVYGIRIKYPSDWTKQEQVPGLVAAFLSPQESASDTYQENFGVFIEDLSTQPMTLEEYTELSVTSIEQLITDANILDSSTTTLDGNSAHKVVYTGRLEQYNLKWMQIWTVKDNTAYVLTYVSEVNKYNDFLDTVQEMVNSFEII